MTTDNFNPHNSVWPNGLKRDEEGYVTFYPLGTNKVNVPTSSSEWPKGNKLVSPFVYQDDKLVGFVDTKALTTNSQTTIYLPYEHIEAEFSAIDKGQLQIYAPNATTKKASWKDSGEEDIPEAQFKYKGCTTVDNVTTVDANYKTTDIVDGTWSEPLWDLEQGGNGEWTGGVFGGCTTLTSFSSDLPSLKNGKHMFNNCSKLTSFSSDLSSLTDGYGMFAYCENLSEFDTDLPSLTKGENMFHFCSDLTSFSTDLPNLTDGSGMFSSCTTLASFSSELPNLTKGENMFNNCDNITSFASDLSKLTSSVQMFYRCINLTSFASELPNLTDGWGMFYMSNLSEFSTDLPNLTNGSYMFNNCYALTSFSTDLPNLTNGSSMFLYCHNLTAFSSDLSKLTNGHHMFNGCKLDTASVQNIADTINTYNGTINIDIGNSTPNTEETAAFNKIASKGWTVYVMGSGGSQSQWNPTSLTPIDGEEISTPIPFWAKPIQSDEEHAKYVDAEGNFFNILGAQFIYGDDLSTYGMFTCEEDAAANMRLTPYIKPIEKQ